MFFISDNGSGVAPEVMAALAAETGPALPYGADPTTAALTLRLREIFEAPEAEVALVPTGTAANALAIATLTPPWGAVFCHATAHIDADECGAAEFFSGGAKLVPLPGEHGKLTPEALRAGLGRFMPGNQHAVIPAALSLTNVTELGTLYTPAEIAALTVEARAQGLACHLDGARFANALAATGATPAEMTWKAGIDLLSLGGTKNGLMGAEAVVLFDPARAAEFRIRRKRGGHLMSKQRYLAAQLRAWLDGGLWLRLAAEANARAARLAAALAELPGVRLCHAVEANMIFAQLPRSLHARARAAGAQFYDMTETAEHVTVRLVCSWSTTDDEIAAFLAALGAESP